MLRNVYLPEIVNGSNSNGNGELPMMEAAVGSSAFVTPAGSNNLFVAGETLTHGDDPS